MGRGGPPAPAHAVELGSTLRVLRPEENEPPVEEGKPAKPRRRFFTSDSNPRDELAEMVNDNPEAAAAILRSWIGEAS